MYACKARTNAKRIKSSEKNSKCTSTYQYVFKFLCPYVLYILICFCVANTCKGEGNRVASY